MVNIHIIVGSTRPGRVGKGVAEWVLASAKKQRTDAVFELVDIADFKLPIFDEPAIPSMIKDSADYTKEHTRKWSAAISNADGYIFVTPEYTHSMSGALKNAIDYLYNEWNNKAAGFVSYGAAGGYRAVEQLRQVMGELQIADVRGQVAFSLMSDFENYTTLKPTEFHEQRLGIMLDQLISWSEALKTVREKKAIK